MSAGLGQRFPGIGCFGCCEPNKLGSCESKSGIHKDGAKALEAIAESAWLVPIMRADVATVIARDATTVDDNGEDDEAKNSGYLDQAENEFDFSS